MLKQRLIINNLFMVVLGFGISVGCKQRGQESDESRAKTIVTQPTDPQKPQNLQFFYYMDAKHSGLGIDLVCWKVCADDCKILGYAPTNRLEEQMLLDPEVAQIYIDAIRPEGVEYDDFATSFPSFAKFTAQFTKNVGKACPLPTQKDAG
jgi:hypothetical protein